MVFCSRTHSQLSQFVGELKRTPFAQRFNTVAVASRKVPPLKFCLHLQACFDRAVSQPLLASMSAAVNPMLQLQWPKKLMTCLSKRQVPHQKKSKIFCPPVVGIISLNLIDCDWRSTGAVHKRQRAEAWQLSAHQRAVPGNAAEQEQPEKGNKGGLVYHPCGTCSSSYGTHTLLQN